MSIAAIMTFAGGIGLFLLGMRLMTDGLKVAAGNTLREILISATRSRLRGVASGVLITTMVQSSSAVIFATIGFVNAGLLTLGQAIGVIYGSNVGTTLTSWIVALVGFNLNLQAFALPAIGLGMGLWVAGGSRRFGALGQALAGLGLFFLGIDILKTGFADVGDAQMLAGWAEGGVGALLLFVLAGTFLTVLMQSSSAALAVTLTAAAGGLIPLQAAAAMVIGANVGTTSTALFAIIGATPAAKRAAMAHVGFNLITAVMALLSLPVLLWLVQAIAGWMGLSSQPATLLAIFHTMTKLLGLMLLWPLTDRLVRQLERWFEPPADQPVRPQYLDRNVQETPSLALDALALELSAMAERSRAAARTALSSESADATGYLEQVCQDQERINLAVAEFVGGLYHQDHDRLLTRVLPLALRSAQYSEFVSDHALAYQRLQAKATIEHEAVQQATNQALSNAVHLLNNLDAGYSTETGFERDYQAAKHAMLVATARNELSANRLAGGLEQLSMLHRLVVDALKAADDLAAFERERLEGSSDEPAASAVA